jgi:hypothetical protein
LAREESNKKKEEEAKKLNIFIYNIPHQKQYIFKNFWHA